MHRQQTSLLSVAKRRETRCSAAPLLGPTGTGGPGNSEDVCLSIVKEQGVTE